MIAFSKLTKRVIVHAMHVGPSLCIHLLLAFMPFAKYFYDKLLDTTLDFVERQNRKTNKVDLF